MKKIVVDIVLPDGTCERVFEMPPHDELAVLINKMSRGAYINKAAVTGLQLSALGKYIKEIDETYFMLYQQAIFSVESRQKAYIEII